jgi:hypothetical protein
VVTVLVVSGEEVEPGEQFHALELGHKVFGVRERKSVFDSYLIQSAIFNYHLEQQFHFGIKALRDEWNWGCARGDRLVD